MMKRLRLLTDQVVWWVAANRFEDSYHSLSSSQLYTEELWVCGQTIHSALSETQLPATPLSPSFTSSKYTGIAIVCQIVLPMALSYGIKVKENELDREQLLSRGVFLKCKLVQL